MMLSVLLRYLTQQLLFVGLQTKQSFLYSTELYFCLFRKPSLPVSTFINVPWSIPTLLFVTLVHVGGCSDLFLLRRCFSNSQSEFVTGLLLVLPVHEKILQVPDIFK